MGEDGVYSYSDDGQLAGVGVWEDFKINAARISQAGVILVVCVDKRLAPSHRSQEPPPALRRVLLGNYGCINKVINGGNVLLRSYQNYLCNLNIMIMT